MNKVIVIGGGLAGVEAAYQIAKREIPVDLYEMRPQKMTEAHTTGFFGEMVCSNSLGSTEISSASGLLKEELCLLDSFFLRLAEKCRVPAGKSLAVDRLKLAQLITEELHQIKNISFLGEEIKELPESEDPIIVASGPLTSADFALNLTRLTLRKNLFFFDATSPIINTQSINLNHVFRGSRYGKGEADFLNIPLTEEEYNRLVKELVEGQTVELENFEKDMYFEACLPIEEIARRGKKSLSFGPLKPVGLIDPKTERMPYAVIQLRQDDLNSRYYQMVGFQTRLKWGEQKRIFRLIPGLENAEFERFGRMHRNTYINAPLIINKFYQCKQKGNLFFAGQISGVEGYVESIASGLICGIYAWQKLTKKTLYNLPENTANGALVGYISQANWRNFKPTKFTFGLLPDLPLPGKNKKISKELKAKLALENLSKWIKKANI